MRVAAEISSSPKASWSERLLLRLAESRFVDGLRIAAESDDEAALQRVQAALGLIRTHDRRRYDRILKDIELIWIRLLPSALALCNDALRACEIDTRFVRDESTTPEMIAAAIVHEATHARLSRCGFAYDLERRQRIEAICVRRELAFAARLPDGDGIRAWTAAHAHESSDALTDEAFAQREREGILEVMRHLGTPEWVLRALLGAAAVRAKVLGYFRRAASA